MPPPVSSPTSIRLHLALNTNQKSRTLIIHTPTTPNPTTPFPSLPILLSAAKNKLKLKKKPKRLFLKDGTEPTTEQAFWEALTGSEEGLILISFGEDFIGASHTASTHPPPAFKRQLHEESGVLYLTFPTSTALFAALGRVHVYYESGGSGEEGGGRLKGPLRGVNFPVEVLGGWMRDVECRWVCGELKEGGEGGGLWTVEEERVLKAVYGDGLHVHGVGCGCLEKVKGRIKVEGSTTGLDELSLQFNDSLQLSTPPSSSSSSSSSADIQNLLFPPLPPTNVTYLLASLPSDPSTTLHEWAHAHFHLSPTYTALCLSTFSSLPPPLRDHITKELLQWGYAADKIVDEFQAYVVEGPLSVFGKKWADGLREVQRGLREGLGVCPFL
ncbi:hypothetical protein HDV05_000712 [Chytridiales sp. JEL 0842]|nr:hypothetical protein HDV05_000712 [Chytridiales sp. JEL 0842]